MQNSLICNISYINGNVICMVFFIIRVTLHVKGGPCPCPISPNTARARFQGVCHICSRQNNTAGRVINTAFRTKA